MINHKKVQVYRNLHKNCWSVRQGGKIVAHRKTLKLENCSFHVQPAGHAKVKKEKRKNVHAYVKGFIIPNRDNKSIINSFYWMIEQWKKFNKNEKRVTYNPYENPFFYNVASKERVDEHDYLYFDKDGKVWML